MSLEDVKATLLAGKEATDEAAALIRSVQEFADHARSVTEATCHDSRHEAVEEGLSLLVDAERQTGLVLRRLHDSADEADEYLRVLG